MFLYWSDFVGTGTSGFASRIRPRAFDAGATDGAMIDLRTDSTSPAGRCLVGSTTLIASPPTGVTFLLDTSTDLDVLVPNAVVNFINTQLGTSYALQTFTWRQLFRRLFTVEGNGRWGTISQTLRFGLAGTIDIR